MNHCRIIAEFGSCHLGKWDRLKEAIDRAKAADLWALKLQLFPNEAPYVPTNIWLDPILFAKAFDYGKQIGLHVSASVFDVFSYEFLLNLKPEFVKFAYSQKTAPYYGDALAECKEVIVSCDPLSDWNLGRSGPGLTKLYCIPDYPVRYEVAFDGIFPRFDGFSDHTLGIRQTQQAIFLGAKVIEKHVRLGYEDELQCPDGRFAVLIEDLKMLWKEDAS